MKTNALTRDEVLHALEICATGDGEACLTCPCGTVPGSDCCGELLEAAAAMLKDRQEHAK